MPNAKLLTGSILATVKTNTRPKAGSLKMNTALEYSTRVVQEGGRRCKKSTLNDIVHLTPLRIPLMNPPLVHFTCYTVYTFSDGGRFA